MKVFNITIKDAYVFHLIANRHRIGISVRYSRCIPQIGSPDITFLVPESHLFRDMSERFGANNCSPSLKKNEGNK